MARRYFEFTDESSNKFWEIWLEGTKVLTRYGKIGANGQTTVKTEASPANAQALHDRLVKEKTAKGYLERGPAPAAVAVVAPPPPGAAVEPGFRRFEFSDGASNKFWEVKVEDTDQLVRFGKLGSAGQQKVKSFDSEAEAKAETRKLIAEKTGKGYVEVGGRPKATGDAQLEAAIEASPDDPSPYLVYADWLQAKGDPLGELIVLQHGAASNPSKKAELAKAAKALIKQHADVFLGALADFPTDEHGKGLKIEWQFGFMKHVTLRWESFEGDGDDPTGDLTALLELPTARFLQGLRLGPVPGDDIMSLQEVIDVLAELKKPATLRELYLGDLGDWDISSTSSGDFGPLAKVFPRLERLTLRGGDIGLGERLVLPELRELTIETGGLTEETIAQVCALKAPKLERLSLWFGDENYGASGGLDDLGRILDGSAFPALKHLGLMNCAWVGDAVRALPQSKVLRQLTSLDLSMGCLSDDDVDAMLAEQAAFQHLAHLNLDDNALSDASKPKVKRLAKQVNFGTEQDPERAADDAYRYVSVGE